jgi:hypothetical protein
MEENELSPSSKEPEVKKPTRFTRHLIHGIPALLLVIVVIVVSFVGISLYWASYQQQAKNITTELFPTYTIPTPTPSTWTIYLNTDAFYQRPPNEIITLNSNSPTDITFSTNNIRYNGHSIYTYGSFAPQIEDYGNSSNPVAQYTIRNGQSNQITVYFPEGTGSPWASGVTVQMSITTSNAQGSTIFKLP